MEKELNFYEVRLTNYCLYQSPTKRQVIKYDAIDFTNYQHRDWYKPILITLEWLKDLGFEKASYQGEVKKGDTLYISDDNDFCIVESKGRFYYAEQEHEDAMYELLIEVKHVHRLQNLYFELTDNELFKK